MLAGECCWKITLSWMAVRTVQMPPRETHGIVLLMHWLSKENRWVASHVGKFCYDFWGNLSVSHISPVSKISLLWNLKVLYWILSILPFDLIVRHLNPVNALILYLPPKDSRPLRFPSVCSATQIIVVWIFLVLIALCSRGGEQASQSFVSSVRQIPQRLQTPPLPLGYVQNLKVSLS